MTFLKANATNAKRFLGLNKKSRDYIVPTIFHRGKY